MSIAPSQNHRAEWERARAIAHQTTHSSSFDGDEAWRPWLTKHAPQYVGAGFAPRHEAFWQWGWSVEPGVRPPPFIAIWNRGGGKSTSTELLTTALLVRKVRRYGLYVSGTQDMADRHVESIGSMLEQLGVQRSVNRYGASRGWRRNRLRAANGFTVDAFGLDVGSRGVKDDEARPDLIVFDDIDQIHDSALTTRKKIETLTMTVLPTAVDYAAVVGVQNLIHANSVFAQLADGRADFLSDRIMSGPHPALLDCCISRTESGEYDVQGVPTWQGQDLAACKRLVKTIGPDAFWRECQHRVELEKLAIYPRVSTCPRFDIPYDWQWYVGLDFGGVHTCAVFIVVNPTNGRRFVVAEYLAGELTSDKHAQAILGMCHGTPFCVGGSKSEGQWRREFRAAGLGVNAPTFSEVEIGIDRVRGAIADEQLIFFDDLRGLLHDLRTYQRVPDMHGKPTTDILNKSSYHYADALRYIVGRLR